MRGRAYETKADLRHNEEWEAIIPLSGDSIDVDAAIAVDFDDRDFTSDVPDDPIYVLPDFNLTKTALKSAQTALRAKLYTHETIVLQRNAELNNVKMEVGRATRLERLTELLSH